MKIPNSLKTPNIAKGKFLKYIAEDLILLDNLLFARSNMTHTFQKPHVNGETLKMLLVGEFEILLAVIW